MNELENDGQLRVVKMNCGMYSVYRGNYMVYGLCSEKRAKAVKELKDRTWRR
jgi:hypothetical protein